MKKIGIFFSIFIFTSAFSKELTLKEAIDIALKNSYQLKAAKKLLKSKEFEYKATKGLKWPTIKFNEMFMRTNVAGWAMMNELNQHRLTMMSSAKYVDMTSMNAMFGMPMFNSPSFPEWNNWQTKLDLQFPLYTAGKISTGIKMRKKEYEATKKDVKRTQQKVIYDVSKAYYGALLAKEAIKLANQAYKTVEKHYKTAKAMYENGLAIYADVLRAKVYLMDVKSKITEAKNHYLIAKKGLLLAMGVDDKNPADIEIVGDLTFKDTEKDVDYWEYYAITHRPDFIALKERVENAKRMVKFVKADMYPMVGVFASYQMDDKKIPLGSDGTGWTAGIALTWKIFDGFQTVNKYKAAKETYKYYSHQKKGFKEFIKFSVYQAYANLQTAKEKLKTAEQNVVWAEEVLKITETRYKNQMASMIDLLDTQTMHDKIKFEKAKATYDANIALLELLFQAGALEKEVLEKENNEITEEINNEKSN
ncbi:MAG: TolC family protein [Aquificae bacterium]|nr:TolC family protein [Aquificota bacterium]